MVILLSMDILVPRKMRLANYIASRAFFIVGSMFLLFLILRSIIFVNVGAVEPSNYSGLFELEWFLFGLLNIGLAFRPPRFAARSPLVVGGICYLVLLLGNLALAFASGKCFDLYGNVYPYAGLNPNEWQACVPIV